MNGGLSRNALTGPQDGGSVGRSRDHKRMEPVMGNRTIQEIPTRTLATVPAGVRDSERAPRGESERERQAKHPRTTAAAATAGIVLLAALLVSCVANPATGKHDFMVISEGQELAIGSESDKQVRSDNRMYTEKPDLVQYVNEVGSRLAAHSDRPKVQFHFGIVDTPDVNAFALPGGFVYVNRGILDQMNSEDELAAVLGHEIGHVAARHGASQMSKAYIAQFGMVGLAAVSDPQYASQIGQLSGIAVNLAFQGFSREDERQADDLGVKYSRHAGYNPRGAIDLLKMLKRMETQEPSRVESWFMSHPRTAERISRVSDEIAELKAKSAPALARPIKRDEYLRKIDGMVVGSYSKDAFVTGGRYYNRAEGLSIAIPKGWTEALGGREKILTMKRAGQSLQAELAVKINTSAGRTADAAQRYQRAAAQAGMETAGPIVKASLPVGDGAVVHMIATSQKGERLDVRALCLVRFDKVITLSFVAPAEKADQFTQTFMDLTGSIEYLSPDKMPAFTEPTVTLYTAAAGDTWASIAAKRIGEGASGDKLAAYNGLDSAGAPPPAGMLIKIPPKAAFLPAGSSTTGSGAR